MAYIGRGLTYYAKGNFESALQDFSQALKLDPENVEAYVHRGITYKDLMEIEAAVTDFSQAIYFDPRCHQAYYNRGILRMAQDKLYLAILDFSTAIDIASLDGISEPYLALLYSKRAIIFLQLGIRHRALKDIQSALKLDPNNEHALISQALTYFQAGDIEQSKQIYSTLVKRQPLHRDANWVINAYGLPMAFNPTLQEILSTSEKEN
jgi:Tfp pilus assembly protein PilF